MHPKGMTAEQAEKRYAQIVATVKGEFAKIPAESFAGEDVTIAIQKQWAAECGVEYKEPAAPMASGPPSAPGEIDEIKTPKTKDEELSPLKRGKPRKATKAAE